MTNADSKAHARHLIAQPKSPERLIDLKRVVNTRHVHKRTKHHCLTAILGDIESMPPQKRIFECAEILKANVSSISTSKFFSSPRIPEDVTQRAARIILVSLEPAGIEPGVRQIDIALLVLAQPDASVDNATRRSAMKVLENNEEYIEPQIQKIAEPILNRFVNARFRPQVDLCLQDLLARQEQFVQQPNF